jgi:NAD(P)-dependent dehydrogenase (short-subunit alcohol dehydrogenase family)|tara:strand:+ start:184 stop:948 length:765 start_codon:yes stop_codon:yes gene_type:complete
MNENKKKIWITGASSGIGKALAIKFATNGWQVAVSARRESLLQDLNKINSNIHSFPLDVKDEFKTKKVFEYIIEKFQTLDIAVFCTGIHDPNAEKKLSSETIRQIMETNFFGTLNCVMATNNYFKEKKSGHISIVSSVAGYRGLPAASGYCASKSALISLAESIYFDFKRHNVRVSVINPGFIKTPMTDKNKFPMPMIKSPEYAAEKIFIGLTKKNVFEIHFPIAFTMIMKLLRIMPNWLYLLIASKGISKIKL